MLTKTAKEYAEKDVEVFNKGQSGFLRALGTGMASNAAGASLASGLTNLANSGAAYDGSSERFASFLNGTRPTALTALQSPLASVSTLASPFMANSAYRNRLRELMGVAPDKTDTAVETIVGDRLPVATGIIAAPTLAMGVADAISHPHGDVRFSKLKGGLAGTAYSVLPALTSIAGSKLLQHWSRRKAEKDFAEYKVKD